MIAFLRDVGPRLDRREILNGKGGSVDLKRSRKQHAEFAEALKAVGVTVKTLPPLPELPDGPVVADAAVILPELIIMARPSAPARAAEVETAASILAEYRPLRRLLSPATLDAGDVLRIGRTLVVGQSARTNSDGVEALAEFVAPFGYEVQPVELRDNVRLRCACSFIPPHFLLVNPAWLDASPFARMKIIEVDEREPRAANTLTVAGTTFTDASFRRTDARLQEQGITTRSVDVSEFLKVEAGLSRLCLLLEPRVSRPADIAPMRFVTPAARSATECFSPAIVHGGLVYVSGQLPVDALTGKPVDNDIEAQTETVLRNLEGVLAASGSALTRTLKLTFYLADLKLADRVKAACARTFTTHRPTGLFVAAKSLEAGCLVALDAIAAVVEE